MSRNKKPKPSYATSRRIRTEARNKRLDKYGSDRFYDLIRQHTRTRST